MSDAWLTAPLASLAGLVQVGQPWWLALLPLALLPWLRTAGRPTRHPWTALLPADPLSRVIDLGCKALASALIVTLLLVLAGLARVGQPVEHVGTGAEIAILLDRSRSMDENLIGPHSETPADGAWRIAGPVRRKSVVARERLDEFVAARPEDRFAMMLFSSVPLLVGDFSPRQALVRAGIEVSAAGRGLSETDIGAALAAALQLFANRPYTGPRVILLVSDGGGRLTTEFQDRLARELRRQRVAVYWIYLRSRYSPALGPELGTDPAPGGEADSAPEAFLHRFLQSTGMPYRAYEADSPDAMARAIDDIKRIEDRPLRYVDTPAAAPLARPLLAMALVMLLVLLWLSGTTRLVDPRQHRSP